MFYSIGTSDLLAGWWSLSVPNHNLSMRPRRIRCQHTFVCAVTYAGIVLVTNPSVENQLIVEERNEH